jgi:hypothetical protein
MGIQEPTDPSTALRRSGRKRRTATSVSDGEETSDSVQITKVRKTGNPKFDEAENSIDKSDAVKITKVRKTGKPTFDEDGAAKTPAGIAAAAAAPTKRKGKAASKTAKTPVTIAAAGAPPSSSGDPGSFDDPKGKGKIKVKGTPEKRPKRYRDHPPQSVAERLSRAEHQRMYVLSRSGQDHLSETFTMAGSTGNVYNIRIGPVPSCDCPDGVKNGTCKHILYIMCKVLKAPKNLVYQAGLLTSELEEIFARAPRRSTGKSNQKPLGEDDCPICFCPLEEGEQVVWCKAQCGSNIHKACFARWRKTKGAAKVTCVMCRQPWQEEDTEKVNEVLKGGRGKVGEDGYVNVAGELGMSGVRDYSSYSPWFTGETRYGWGLYRRKR